MNKLSKIMDGYKTYTGIIVAFIGVLGISNYITETETAELLNKIFEVAGLVIAIYGRLVVQPK